nr:hypothetical protein [uncultured Draconibacterium sp.]
MKAKSATFKHFFIGCLIFAGSFSVKAQSHNREIYIHAHNDYLSEKPLINALNAGAKSIEADVFLIDGKLYVAHTKEEITQENTFENSYIMPLKRYLLKQDSKPDFHLMLDIKSEAVPTLNEIQNTLLKYPDIFSDDGIKVIISGNRPNPEFYNKYASFIFFDGRKPGDAEGINAGKVAIISQNFSVFTKWRGEGNLPNSEKQKLIKFVNDCHAKHKPVRFWNTGDNEKMYDFLISIGADYINTDSPKNLRKYLNQIN